MKLALRVVLVAVMVAIIGTAFSAFAASTSDVGDPMYCFGVNVRVRAAPSTKAKINLQISKSIVWVVAKKNTGEKYPWYQIKSEGDNKILGWIYGQFVREIDGSEEDVDFLSVPDLRERVN